jgi:hypothetical protein
MRLLHRDKNGAPSGPIRAENQRRAVDSISISIHTADDAAIMRHRILPTVAAEHRADHPKPPATAAPHGPVRLA